MSRVSVKDYLMTVMDTVTLIDEPRRTLPKNEAIGNLGVILKLTSSEKRDTMPRARVLGQGGFKVTTYQAMIALMTQDEDELLARNRVDDMVDDLTQAMRAVALPVTLTDSRTGEVSTLDYLGENFQVLEEDVESVENDIGEETGVQAFCVVSFVVVTRVQM